MKYDIINRGDELSIELTEKFHVLAKQYGLVRDEQWPDTVVSIGGDGTLLHAFHLYKSRLEQVSFVGIHTGHLGFYADWKPDELEQLVQSMAENSNDPDQRNVYYPVVEVSITTNKGIERHIALNEVTIKGVDGTLVAQMNINDEPFEMFRGDGICISTPSGSTAYNKSLGGAVIHPSIEAIQIAGIASINNRVYRSLGSSILMPQHHHCDIYPRAKQKLHVAIDHLSDFRSDIISIRCMVANEKVSFSRFRPFPFWSRVREAFIGNDMIK